jgi:hypothetical protein
MGLSQHLCRCQEAAIRYIKVEAGALAVVGNDCGAISRNFKFVGSKLQNGCERRSLGNIEHFERQLWVAGQCDLEGNFGSRGCGRG